jgi:hypothetical protein
MGLSDAAFPITPYDDVAPNEYIQTYSIILTGIAFPVTIRCAANWFFAVADRFRAHHAVPAWSEKQNSSNLLC